jgi:hypothetical protein
MSIRNKIPTSINAIKKDFSQVSIDTSAIEKVASQIQDTPTLDWDFPYVYSGSIEKTYNYFLVFSALSFYYWGTPKWYKSFNKEKLGGSESLFYCLTENIKKGNDFTNPKFISSLNINEFRRLLLGDDNTELPLIKERFIILKEIAEELSAKYNNSFLYLCVQSGFDASRIVEQLVNDFKCFDDKSLFRNREVYFYKKAQESVTLVHEYLANKGESKFLNIDQLTASSDYKLPQILISLGILKVSEDLKQKLYNLYIFHHSDEIIAEIRSSTILAVDMISDKLSIQSSDISNKLWNLSQDKSLLSIPYPRTISQFI